MIVQETNCPGNRDRLTSSTDCVFISYETVLGLNLARLAKMRLSLVGLIGWIWQDDSPIGEYPHEDIANKIVEFDHFLYICTTTSHECPGQLEERGWAKANSKRLIVIAFDEKDVSPVLSNVRQIRTTNGRYQDACDEAAAEFLRQNRVNLPPVTVEPATSEVRVQIEISQ
jgi:hypothetical protein